MLNENHQRRQEETRRQLEWDLYSADLKDWAGEPTSEQLLPPGKARCVACGRNDLLAVSTSDGRRVLLEEVGDGGPWAVKDGRASLSEAGEHLEHLKVCSGGN